jgi:hypothetical protein
LQPADRLPPHPALATAGAANADSVSIASGGQGLLGSGQATAISNSQAASVLGPSRSSSTAIANGRK